MSTFLDDQIVDLYDSFMNHEISYREFQKKHGVIVAEKLNADPTLINLKRVVNGLNMAVDRITKTYGRSILKKLSYDKLYNEMFHG